MDFLKNNRRFSFLYDGKSLDKLNYTVNVTEDGNTLTTEYCLDDGLKITNIANKHEKFNAYEWVNYIENTSDKPSKLITELYDCDCSLDFEHEDKRKWTAYFPDKDSATKVYAPSGSTWSPDEFCCDADLIIENTRVNHIYPGQTKEYSTIGGRSSNKHAPFFNISKNNGGIIFAIGWTGQWNCAVSREEDSVTIKTKIEDTHFILMSGEKIRTSSIVIMPYTGNFTQSQNKWRRLVKEDFSPLGKEGRDCYGPLCASIWGGMKTESVLKRIKTIKNNNLPITHIWMDAGWYGESTDPTPDEFEGDWPTHTGDWVVSSKIHPNGLTDVSKAIHDAGMKFILWFEPERVMRNTPITKIHPEYFYEVSADNNNLLLNLGDENAWSYCFNTISGLIEKLNIDFYRQDFNFNPLPYWRKADADDRKGMTEIKHINGLYRLWDALLEKFPHIMIDNCASGGRRLDIETLRRSQPLWRSDYMCPANYDDFAAQCHALNFNTWMPYSGTGSGRIYDIYNMRSSYGSSLTTNYTFSEREEFGNDAEKMKLLKKFTDEYIKVRPYFSEDFYPLTEYPDKTDVWCAMQFDRPEGNDGIIQLFRRENSPYSTAVFNLGGIDKNAEYTFCDADSNESFVVSGKSLAENGFKITIDKPHTSKILFYSHN